jgi:predicted nucleic acid-binding protein
MGALMVSALSIALATGRSAYDSMDLALADLLGSKVVTADRKLYNGLQSGPYARLIAWVEDELGNESTPPIG